MALAQVNSSRSLCSILLVVPWDQQMLAFLSTPTQCLKSQGKLSFRCYTLCFEDRSDSTRSWGVCMVQLPSEICRGFWKGQIRGPPCTAWSVSSVQKLPDANAHTGGLACLPAVKLMLLWMLLSNCMWCLFAVTHRALSELWLRCVLPSACFF